ncbi:MAG: signal peptidase I [Candidatus Hydrogenedentes bacterium]|nr:signal peptidase I [Candidatus Hydrogenedentota bacterium]
MAIDGDEIAKLHAEAKRIRKNFRYIHKDLKRSPENIDLLRQRDHLRKRYEQIQARLNEAKAAGDAVPREQEDDSDGEAIDMSIFEPKPYEIPAAVNVKQRAAVSGGLGGSMISAKDIRNIVSVALLIIVLPFFYLYFVKGMRFYEVPTKSMEPTLKPGDRIIAVRPPRYERGDVVVLPDPQNPGDFLVKRLVAFGADTIEIANGNLFVNGQPVGETYTNGPAEGKLALTTVPDGNVYLLGDNRNDSEDSRAWGPRPIADLVGRVWFVYAPSGRRGSLANHAAAFSDVPAP